MAIAIFLILIQIVAPVSAEESTTAYKRLREEAKRDTSLIIVIRVEYLNYGRCPSYSS